MRASVAEERRSVARVESVTDATGSGGPLAESTRDRDAVIGDGCATTEFRQSTSDRKIDQPGAPGRHRTRRQIHPDDQPGCRGVGAGLYLAGFLLPLSARRAVT